MVHLYDIEPDIDEIVEDSFDQYLAFFDADSNDPAVVKTTPLGDEVVALAYDNENGILYGARETGIAIIDEQLGTITGDSDFGSRLMGSRIQAMNFDPINKVLIATTDNNEVLAIDPNTGDLATITTTSASLVGITYKVQ